MRIQIESTTKIVQLNGVPARIWEGHTEAGVPIHCYITRVAVRTDQPCDEFEQDLEDHAPPSAAVEAIPARLIL